MESLMKTSTKIATSATLINGTRVYAKGSPHMPGRIVGSVNSEGKVRILFDSIHGTWQSGIDDLIIIEA
jgi:hypothetical protein